MEKHSWGGIVLSLSLNNLGAGDSTDSAGVFRAIRILRGHFSSPEDGGFEHKDLINPTLVSSQVATSPRDSRNSPSLPTLHLPPTNRLGLIQRVDPLSPKGNDIPRGKCSSSPAPTGALAAGIGRRQGVDQMTSGAAPSPVHTGQDGGYPKCAGMFREWVQGPQRPPELSATLWQMPGKRQRKG